MRPGVIITFNHNPTSPVSKTLKEHPQTSNSIQKSLDYDHRSLQERVSVVVFPPRSEDTLRDDPSTTQQSIHLSPNPASRNHQKHHRKPLAEPLEDLQIIPTGFHHDSKHLPRPTQLKIGRTNQNTLLCTDHLTESRTSSPYGGLSRFQFYARFPIFGFSVRIRYLL
jgi:hypothetical protein